MQFKTEKQPPFRAVSLPGPNMSTSPSSAIGPTATLPPTPLVNGDMTHMVRQLEATQQGLPVEFYFFLREKEWKTWENQKDEILERLYAAVEDFGLSIYQLYIK